jgi:hypothetical protein
MSFLGGSGGKDMRPKKVLFGLVRDKDGRPKVDGNPDHLPPQIKAMLTQEDRDYLGMKEAD